MLHPPPGESHGLMNRQSIQYEIFCLFSPLLVSLENNTISHWDTLYILVFLTKRLGKEGKKIGFGTRVLGKISGAHSGFFFEVVAGFTGFVALGDQPARRWPQLWCPTTFPSSTPFSTSTSFSRALSAPSPTTAFPWPAPSFAQCR